MVINGPRFQASVRGFITERSFGDISGEECRLLLLFLFSALIGEVQIIIGFLLALLYTCLSLVIVLQ